VIHQDHDPRKAGCSLNHDPRGSQNHDPGFCGDFLNPPHGCDRLTRIVTFATGLPPRPSMSRPAPMATRAGRGACAAAEDASRRSGRNSRMTAEDRRGRGRTQNASRDRAPVPRLERLRFRRP
jgi:hypothetical protein